MSMSYRLCNNEELFIEHFWKEYENKHVFRTGDSGYFDEERYLFSLDG